MAHIVDQEPLSLRVYTSWGQYFAHALKLNFIVFKSLFESVFKVYFYVWVYFGKMGLFS